MEVDYSKILIPNKVMLTDLSVNDAMSELIDTITDMVSNAIDKGVGKSLIKSVTFNDKKKVTTVVLKNKSVGIARCSKGDVYDRRVGFCVAYMNALFGSKTRVKRIVDKYGKIDGE